ncbi:MAG: OsmC family protein [Chloroflexota bacterium]|nr:OsmC family protein [Chloroflexota bacterium]
MSIGEAVAAASAYLTAHPDEARYRDTMAVARLDSGLAVMVTGADGATLRTDMPSGVGGTASAPSPGWFLRAAEASCVASLVAMRAAALGIDIGPIEVEVDSESDDRGILGLSDEVPAGPLSSRIVVTITAPGRSPGEIEDLARWAVGHCPVTDAVRRAVPLEVVVRGGEAVSR